MWALADARMVRMALLAGGVSLALSAAAPALAAEDAPLAAVPPTPYAQALKAFDQAWDDAPLAFATATFVKAPAQGYGLYDKRDDVPFASGETLYVYAEPVAYGFEPSAEGETYRLTAGFQLLTLSGQVLAEEPEFASFSGTTRSRKRELSTQLSFAFDGLPDGIYTLSIRLSDAVTNQTTQTNLRFAVASASN